MTESATPDPLERARPYLFYQTAARLPLVKKADGIYIWDEEGKEYIDGCSGAMISHLGHGHPRLARAMADQMASGVVFAYRTQFESRPALELAGALVDASAAHLDRVFYVSGGSEAVESAMKICRQYFWARGEGARHVFISRSPAYHGSTLGALALTTYAPLEIPFRPLIRSYPKIPAPYCYRCHYGLAYPDCGIRCARDLETAILDQGPGNVAAFVAEPIGGASTGAVVPPEEYFPIIQEICRKYGIFLIFDEVMTAFGRTGRLFAYEHWNTEVDVVALSKGMGSGYYPLGAIVTRQEIADTVVESGGFQHGHTYAGNPMACTVGLEVMDIIRDEGLCDNAAAMGAVLKEGLSALADRYPMIGDVRGRGLLLGIELVADRETRTPFPKERNMNLRLTAECRKKGLILYPRRCINGLSGDHLTVAPPLIVNRKQVEGILGRLDGALARLAH